jgi:RecB family endonuclease NucS
MLHHIVTPSPSEALSFIQTYHSGTTEKTVLIITGECIVDYRGRARSFLDWGERMVMIKQDGTVLVHRPIMREPVNWQPAGAITRFSVHKDMLVMYSYHKSPPEKMKTVFRSLKMVMVSALRDTSELVLSGMEADVVNQIVENPEVLEDGLRICKREKPVKSGMIDLFGYDKNHVPVVIEVKRSLANISAVQQLRMYVNDIKQDIDEVFVRGILCAPKIPDMVKKLLDDYDLEWQEIERKVILPDDYQKKLHEFIKKK